MDPFHSALLLLMLLPIYVRTSLVLFLSTESSGLLFWLRPSLSIWVQVTFVYMNDCYVSGFFWSCQVSTCDLQARALPGMAMTPDVSEYHIRWSVILLLQWTGLLIVTGLFHRMVSQMSSSSCLETKGKRNIECSCFHSRSKSEFRGRVSM